MPLRVPSIQRSVLPTVAPTPTVTPEAMGAGVGRGLESLGASISQTAQTVNRMQQESAAEDAQKSYAKLAESYREVLHTGDSAFYRQKGADARGAYGDLENRLKDLENTYREGLNPRARQAFDRIAAQRRSSIMNDAAVYAGREHERALRTANESVLQQSQLDIVANPVPSSQEWQDSMAIIADTVRATPGATPAEQQAIARDVYTRAHTAAIESILQTGTPEQAEAYLDTDIGGGQKVRDTIAADRMVKINEALERSGMVAFGQRWADKAAEEYGHVDAKDGLPLALEKVRAEVPAGERRQEAERAVGLRFREMAIAEQQERTDRYNNYLGNILSAPTAERAVEVAQNSWGLEPAQRGELLKIAASRAKVPTNKKNPENSASQVELMGAVDRGELSAEQARGAMIAAGGSTEQIDEVVQYAQQGGLAGEVQITTIGTIASRFDKSMSGEKLARLKDLIVRDLRAEKPGQPLTRAELESRVAGYMASGEYDDNTAWYNVFGWGDPNATALNAAGQTVTVDGQEVSALGTWLPDITEAEQASYKWELMDMGVNPASIDDNMLQVYKKSRKLMLPLSPAQAKMAVWDRQRAPVADSRVRSAAQGGQENAGLDAALRAATE